MNEDVEKKIDDIMEDLIVGHNFEYAGKALKELFSKSMEQAERRHIQTVADTIQRMRPMMLNKIDGKEEFAMYWDDETQLWNRARYKDLIAEAKRQLKGESGV